jgi:hypothetical protein
VQIEVERVLRPADLRQRPQFHRAQEHRAVGRRAHEDRDRLAPAQREQPFGHAVRALLRSVTLAEEIAEFGAGHLALELGLAQAGGHEPVLLEQHVLVEADVGHADRALLAQRAVVAEDRHLVERMLARTVQRAVAVVVAHRVGGRHEHEPTRVEQRSEPGVVLSRHRDGAGDRDCHRQALADRLVEQHPQAPQVRAAERGQAVLEHLVELGDLGHGLVHELGARIRSRARSRTGA